MEEISDTKVAIIVIGILGIGMEVVSYVGTGSMDIGTMGLMITAIAALAGHDLRKKEKTL